MCCLEAFLQCFKYVMLFKTKLFKPNPKQIKK